MSTPFLGPTVRYLDTISFSQISKITLKAGGGESSWPEEQCKSGTKQSPINIDRTVSDFEMVNDMEPFMFSGFNQTPTAAKLMNIGFTVKATFEFTETTQKKPMVKIYFELSIFTEFLNCRFRAAA